MGLNDPLPIRYVRWLGGLAQGDLGKSFLTARTVAEIIGERIVPTLILGLSAFAVTSISGIGLGVLFGLTRQLALRSGGPGHHTAAGGRPLVLAGLVTGHLHL